MERSFADAANNHRFKHAHWRGLWKQAIQALLIGHLPEPAQAGAALGRLWWLVKLLFRPDRAFPPNLFPKELPLSSSTSTRVH